MKLDNLCIIAQGGGVRSVYTAGVIDGLVKKFSLTEVGNIVASSGSAANFMYYTSGQFEEINKIWLGLIESKRFVKLSNVFLNKSILDIDFLVDEMVSKRFPFNEKLFKNSRTQIHIPVLRYKDGKNVYFSNKDQVNPFELMRATCAVPYFYGKKVKINKDHYIDGSLADIFGINKALEINSDNLLVILTEPIKNIDKGPNFFIRGILNCLFFRKESPNIRKKIWDIFSNYQKDKDLLFDLSIKKNIFIIYPKKDLKIDRLGSNYELVKETLNLGYKDVVNNLDLEKFIQNIKSIEK